MPFTTMCVSFRISAAAIRASSWVNLSNRFRASSISFFPTSFFRNFPEHRLAAIEYRQEQRTRSTLSHFLRCNREDVQHLDHDLYSYVRHGTCWRHCCIRLKALEEVLDTLEELDKDILAGFNFFGCL
jgi:hypothetical protein